MRIRLLSALAALVLAIVGVVLIVSYVQGANQRAYGEAQTVNVFVVIAAIPAGTAAEDLSDSLEMREVPEAVVPDNAVSDLSGYAGRVIGVDLVVGEQLLDSRLVDPQALQPAGTVTVPEGMQEFTVQFAADRVIGGRISAGDTVGIFVTAIPGAAQGSQTRHEFHRVLVTSVQGLAAANEDGLPSSALPAGSVMVAFATSIADAEKIIWAAQNTSLWLSRESAEATDDGATGATAEDFFK